MTESQETLRALEDLPALDAEALMQWTADLDAGVARLFAQTTEGLAYGLGGRLIVFGNEDLRQIAAHPAAGNMPADVLGLAFGVNPDQTSVSPEQASGVSMARLVKNQVFTANPPLHGPTRQLLARQFIPKQLPRFAPLIQDTVELLVAEACACESVDFGHQFTERLTARFWAELLGLTPQEEVRAKALIGALTPMFFLVRTDEETLSADAAAAEYLDLVSAAVDRAVETGGNDLIDEMEADFQAIEHPDRPESLGVMLAANLIEGFHTAALAAANAVFCLLRQPDALSRVRGDPSLVAAAVFEGLRLAPPVILTQRYALEDFVHEGVLVPQGTPIIMLWIAGNRDPKAFAEPSRLDLDRRQRGDATFGGGAHLCPGKNVARTLAEAVLRGVTAPNIAIELVDHDYEWIPRSSMRQLGALPVRIRRLR